MSTRVGYRIIHASSKWKAGRPFSRPPAIGKRVHHSIFGAGTVVGALKASKPRARKVYESTIINFDAHGTKELMWAFCSTKVCALIAVNA